MRVTVRTEHYTTASRAGFYRAGDLGHIACVTMTSCCTAMQEAWEAHAIGCGEHGEEPLNMNRTVNNRAEHSHQPTRQRVRRRQGLKSPGHAQRFLAAYGPIAEHVRPCRHRF